MEAWWWLRHVAGAQGMSAPEWQALLAAGQRCHLRRWARTSWTTAGVLLVTRGRVRLRRPGGGPSLLLAAGDLVGMVEQRSCLVEARRDSTFYIFSHEEWLSCLRALPALTQRLLQLLARRALRREGPPGIPGAPGRER